MNFLTRTGAGTTTFDPSSFMKMSQARMGAMPFNYMTMDVGDEVSGAQGLFNTVAGGFTSAAGAGLLGGFMG